MSRNPSLFVSHHGPMLAIGDNPGRRFLEAYGNQLQRPKAILVISPYWETRHPTLETIYDPDTIHDFADVPKELYRITYPAPGAPDLAYRASILLEKAGVSVDFEPIRGLDHGAWVPLSLMYPDADVPVTQLSLQPPLGPVHHLRLGQALYPLCDEEVLVIGTGSLIHGTSGLLGEDNARLPPQWIEKFGTWAARMISDGQIDELLEYRKQGPHVEGIHPTEEQILPLFTAFGVAGPAAKHRRVHSSGGFDARSLEVYAFA